MTSGVRIASPAELSVGEKGAWQELHEALPALRTPFFSPIFARLAAAVRPEARVAIVEAGRAIKGFFPFQARPGHLAIGIAGPLTDYEGLVAPDDLDIDARDLLRGCGLTVFDFANVPARQKAFEPYQEMTDRSHRIDLAEGYDAYVAQMNTPDTKVFADTRAKGRRLERRVGPLRFEFHDTDPRAFEALVHWKRQQYAASSAIDSLAWPWTRDLLKRIYETQTPEFAGVLSTLYAGGDLVAAHFGMRSRDVLHYWFPAYDNSQAKFSPGMVLLLRLAEACAQQGLNIIDLGGGSYEFKMRLSNTGIPIAEGSVVLPSVNTAFAARMISRLTERTFEALPLGRYSTIPRRGFRKLRSYRAYS